MAKDDFKLRFIHMCVCGSEWMCARVFRVELLYGTMKREWQANNFFLSILSLGKIFHPSSQAV